MNNHEIKNPGTSFDNVPGFSNNNFGNNFGNNYISKKEAIKRDVWEVITKLFENGFDQSEIIEALAEIVREEKQDHKEVYNCDCCEGVTI